MKNVSKLFQIFHSISFSTWNTSEWERVCRAQSLLNMRVRGQNREPQVRGLALKSGLTHKRTGITPRWKILVRDSYVWNLRPMVDANVSSNVSTKPGNLCNISICIRLTDQLSTLNPYFWLQLSWPASIHSGWLSYQLGNTFWLTY